MLDAGPDGAFAWLIAAVTAQDGSRIKVAYFWLTGVLSAILDNAPTYLVFFNLAGGNATELMGPLARRWPRSPWARSIWARSPISVTHRIS